MGAPSPAEGVRELLATTGAGTRVMRPFVWRAPAGNRTLTEPRLTEPPSGPIEACVRLGTAVGEHAATIIHRSAMAESRRVGTE